MVLTGEPHECHKTMRMPMPIRMGCPSLLAREVAMTNKKRVTGTGLGEIGNGYIIEVSNWTGLDEHQQLKMTQTFVLSAQDTSKKWEDIFNRAQQRLENSKTMVCLYLH